MQLVLSIFPGIDLLGRGFEEEGFCVVRGPDLIFGGDVRSFHVPFPNGFSGVIGGSPCQDFSRSRRSAPTGYGMEMMGEFRRIIHECEPRWFLLENVPGAPGIELGTVKIGRPGHQTRIDYTIQRIDIDGRECGLRQRRLRHFQFGYKSMTPKKPLVVARTREGVTDLAAALATEGRRVGRRNWDDFCRLQGIEPLLLPGMSIAAKYAAVGNGVPVPMARLLARSIRQWRDNRDSVAVCGCGCARPVEPRQTYALPCCRKRMQRRRDFAADIQRGRVTQFA